MELAVPIKKIGIKSGGWERASAVDTGIGMGKPSFALSATIRKESIPRIR
jgi:hypothetical protein